MIGENIKRARKAKGLSQEEMAVRLHVVRQTVSKWEKGLSVPDAGIVMQIAELLDVPVSLLLGVELQGDAEQELSERLAEMNEELAVMARKEKLNGQANRKRGMILFLAFLSMWIAFAAENEVVSILAFSGCAAASLVILYRNLALLTSVTTGDIKLRTLRLTTVFDIGIILFVTAIVLLTQADLLSMSEEREKLLALGLTEILILFAGFISPRLPFSRHTGLRLPWTVQDEDTWNVAHKAVGYISLPLAVGYLAAALTLSDFAAVSGAAILLLIGIPGIISLLFVQKKMKGKLS